MTVHAPRKKPKRMGRLGKIRRLTLQERLDIIHEAQDQGRGHDPSVWTKRYRKFRKRALAKTERRLRREETMDTARWEEKNKARIQAARERLGL